jgi:hypothetical protein
MYPRISSIWGPSPEPDSKLPLAALDDDFLPWRPGRTNPMSGRFVVVLPLVDAAPLDRRRSHAA